MPSGGWLAVVCQWRSERRASRRCFDCDNRISFLHSPFAFAASNRDAKYTRRSHIYFWHGCRFLLTYIGIPSKLPHMKKRTTVWLPEELLERLKKLSRKTGAPMAELFRRAVEAYVRRQT
jgi:hypothetical protein